jgi:hypothetical protein
MAKEGCISSFLRHIKYQLVITLLSYTSSFLSVQKPGNQQPIPADTLANANSDIIMLPAVEF